MPSAATALCVYCRKRPVEHRWAPFCSERCKLLDLAAWADGTYRVPGEPLRESGEEETGTGEREH
jgi:endogenous inhibitor of DNA gyrase (YacG/DUF329 family)